MAGSEKPDGLTPSLSKLMRVIADFLSPLFQDSQRYDRASESIFRTLTRHMVAHDEPIAEVENTQDEDQQASVVSAFLALASLRESFSQCEYYFRRFPFSGLPVSHADHLRNVCEMYFDRIEQFRARLKILLNALKAYEGKPDNRYGELIREFGKFFAQDEQTI